MPTYRLETLEDARDSVRALLNHCSELFAEVEADWDREVVRKDTLNQLQHAANVLLDSEAVLQWFADRRKAAKPANRNGHE